MRADHPGPASAVGARPRPAARQAEGLLAQAAIYLPIYRDAALVVVTDGCSASRSPGRSNIDLRRLPRGGRCRNEPNRARRAGSLLVHAHPDDECDDRRHDRPLSRRRRRVVVVTFTLGEGEVIGERWALLVADGGADQLGGFRIGELAAALAALSPDQAAPLARASSAGRAGA